MSFSKSFLFVFALVLLAKSYAFTITPFHSPSIDRTCVQQNVIASPLHDTQITLHVDPPQQHNDVFSNQTKLSEIEKANKLNEFNALQKNEAENWLQKNARSFIQNKGQLMDKMILTLKEVFHTSVTEYFI